MDNKYDELINFEITNDIDYFMRIIGVPHELVVQIENLQKLTDKGKKAGIKRITRLIKQYPHVGELLTILSLLYENMGDQKKSDELRFLAVERHPDFFFGLLNLTTYHYAKDDYEKIRELLGPNFSLKELYPERDIFYINEVIGMFRMAALYHISQRDFDKANGFMDFIKDNNADEEYEMLALTLKEEELDIRMEENDNNIEIVETLINYGDKIDKPVFKIELIEELYNYGTEIESEIIEKLLKMDRDILIGDLNLILSDSIERYKCFSDLAEENGYADEKLSFLMHAIFLLGELEATESLDNILEVLSQNYEVTNFYLNDILTEYLWISVYKIANNNLNACKAFIIKAGVNAFNKSAVADAICQIHFHQTERHQEVIDWYKDIFQFFINSSTDDNVIDSNFIGMTIGDAIDIKGIELLPEIEQLFDLKRVDILINGNFKAVVDEINTEDPHSYKREIIDIYSIYNKINSWSDNTANAQMDKDFDDFLANKELEIREKGMEEIATPIINETKKVGRNEPCPCGSGKKYKKCCLNK